MLRYDIEHGKCYLNEKEICLCEADRHLDFLLPKYQFKKREVDTKIVIGVKRDRWEELYKKEKMFFDNRYTSLNKTMENLERDLEGKKMDIVRVMQNDEVKVLKKMRVRTLAEQQVAIENNLKALRQLGQMRMMPEFHMRPFALIALMFAIHVNKVSEEEFQKKELEKEERVIELVKSIVIDENVRVDGEVFDLDKSAFVHFARFVFGPMFAVKLGPITEVGLSKFACLGVHGYN